MKKDDAQRHDATMRGEYDFSRGVRGRYADRFAQGSNVVVLDPDVARLFSTSEAVNRALRSFAELVRIQVPTGGASGS